MTEDDTARQAPRLWRRLTRAAAVIAIVGLIGLFAATVMGLREFPDDLASLAQSAVKSQVLARDGTPLSYTLENEWNSTDVVPLDAVPILLQQAFIAAEDQHFYQHHGIDWPARMAALWQDLRDGSPVRGASTITEQVVRIIHPRPRSLWSRWLASFEAGSLEARFSKQQILAFYLNQVPFAERRRGVVQAARFYYDRGLDTLSPAEQLSLAVFVRSPHGMDLRHDKPRAQAAIQRLADRLSLCGDLTVAQRHAIDTDPLSLAAADSAVEASHFVRFVLNESGKHTRDAPPRVLSTLDSHLQSVTQATLTAALQSQSKRHVKDAAVLVIDNRNNEIQAWVVAHAAPSEEALQLGYDTVLTPRQPGSTLKPLLYALALEKGWTAATMIDDSELSESIGNGQHTFHNYSHLHYGPVRLREALGNSLNIPAVKTLEFVGTEPFLDRLHVLGVTSLQQHPDFYGDGLALGNGEVSLYEMAQAYTALARAGRYRPLTVLADGSDDRSDRLVFSPEVATLISDILSDPEARRLEFGRGLQFPVQTAIKTGTSTDYRDAWAIAYDYRHTVAAWMGNLDGTAMNGITGAIGPAMVLRSVFSELNRHQDTEDLLRSPRLVEATICRRDGRLADGNCESTSEWFVPGTLPPPTKSTTATAPAQAQALALAATVDASTKPYRLLQPTAGLIVAHDPRIPSEFEALPMRVARVPGMRRVDWYVDGKREASTNDDRYAWPLVSGTHEVYGQIWDAGSATAHMTEVIRFHVR